MRVVLVSTHIDQTTGYSKVSYNLLKQLASLAPKVKTYHFGFQRHPSRSGFRKVPDGIVSYDAAANEDPKEEGFGFNKIHEYLDMVQPDLVIIYNDPLVIHRFLEAMKHDRAKSSYKLWLYVDQVYEGIAQPLIESLNSHADRIICFSEHWKKVYLEYGGCSVPVDVLEHAVDTSIFSKLPADVRMSQRSGMNIPHNATVFLNANRNSQRKRLDLTIAGFVRLMTRRPTEPYYLMIVSNVNPQSGSYYDIQRIYIEELKRHNLLQPDFLSRLLLIDTASTNTIIDDEGINKIYNVCDIGVNTSDGEGFGLCQLEHLYTGAPQVVTDVGTYSSFMKENVAEFIPCGDRVYFAGGMPLGGWAPSFTVQSVADALERAADSLDAKRRNVTTEFTFSSWAKVCDQFLEEILKV